MKKISVIFAVLIVTVVGLLAVKNEPLQDLPDQSSGQPESPASPIVKPKPTPNVKPNPKPNPEPTKNDSVSDNFERTSLGNNWNPTPYGRPGIINNSDLGIVANGFSIVYWIGSVFPADQFSEATISADKDPNMLTQVFVRRRDSDGARYGFHYNGEKAPFQWEIKYDGVQNAQTRILARTSAFPAPQPGNTLRVAVSGKTIFGYHNGELILSATDNEPQAIMNGRPGLAFRLIKNLPVSAPSPVWESWRGGSFETQ